MTPGGNDQLGPQDRDVDPGSKPGRCKHKVVPGHAPPAAAAGRKEQETGGEDQAVDEAEELLAKYRPVEISGHIDDVYDAGERDAHREQR